jgi:hypothetical protein
MTPDKTYHIATASKDSEEIVRTVASNLTRYLASKGRSKKQYLMWMETQDATWARPARVKRWVGMGLAHGPRGPLVTDELASICLAAAYMNKSPREVMFSDIPLDRL